MYAPIQLLYGDYYCHSTINEHKKAIEFYLEGARHMGQNAEPYVKLGLCHEKLREFDDAIRFFGKALRREKN